MVPYKHKPLDVFIRLRMQLKIGLQMRFVLAQVTVVIPSQHRYILGTRLTPVRLNMANQFLHTVSAVFDAYATLI